ncbi:UNVERIFIED_CONTAM: hypothetical protein GTU68_023401 [Idotea baltica]|nr:hypothetical protein [Idotea baltica]
MHFSFLMNQQQAYIFMT